MAAMIAAAVSCCSAPIAEALRQAEEICARRGARLTPLRRRVLELLLASPAPAKAYDLLAELGGPGAAAKPPTVYRSLDFLMEMGLAHRVESLNAYVACGHRGHGHAAAFLICEQCGAAAELHAPEGARALAGEAGAAGFALRTAVIEMRGVCAACR
jgi:Fur family zinc uptake transcriptional regulator